MEVRMMSSYRPTYSLGKKLCILAGRKGLPSREGELTSKGALFEEGEFRFLKMPKERRVKFLSSGRARSSPYPCSTNNIEECKPEAQLENAEDVKSWEEARCPICMEIPHNAVLLVCSSYENGCRPYMCNTSCRLSNCLDQFCKSSDSPSSATLQQTSSQGTSYDEFDECLQPLQRRDFETELQPKLICPLCRGKVDGWFVAEPARQFMNSKPRSCSCENCDFVGNYKELRLHAKTKHPSVRPSEVDPQRQEDWTRLENESNLQDLLALGELNQGNEEDESMMEGNFFELLFGSMINHIGLEFSPIYGSLFGSLTDLDYDLDLNDAIIWDYEGVRSSDRFRNNQQGRRFHGLNLFRSNNRSRDNLFGSLSSGSTAGLDYDSDLMNVTTWNSSVGTSWNYEVGSYSRSRDNIFGSMSGSSTALEYELRLNDAIMWDDVTREDEGVRSSNRFRNNQQGRRFHGQNIFRQSTNFGSNVNSRQNNWQDNHNHNRQSNDGSSNGGGRMNHRQNNNVRRNNNIRRENNLRGHFF